MLLVCVLSCLRSSCALCYRLPRGRGHPGPPSTRIAPALYRGRASRTPAARSGFVVQLHPQIASREFEIEGLVAAARKRSDRRVQRRGEGLHARNELEEAVLDLDVRHPCIVAREEFFNMKNARSVECGGTYNDWHTFKTAPCCGNLSNSSFVRVYSSLTIVVSLHPLDRIRYVRVGQGGSEFEPSALHPSYR